MPRPRTRCSVTQPVGLRNVAAIGRKPRGGIRRAARRLPAHAYKGVIPKDRWREPYMSKNELQNEIDEGVAFWGYEENGSLVGVMGLQQVQDVTLIRHAYVRTSGQRRGMGAHQ